MGHQHFAFIEVRPLQWVRNPQRSSQQPSIVTTVDLSGQVLLIATTLYTRFAKFPLDDTLFLKEEHTTETVISETLFLDQRAQNKLLISSIVSLKTPEDICER